MASPLLNLYEFEKSIVDIKRYLTKEDAILTDILKLQEEKLGRVDSPEFKSYEIVSLNNSVNKALKNITKLQLLLQNNLLQAEKLLQTLESSDDEEG